MEKMDIKKITLKQRVLRPFQNRRRKALLLGCALCAQAGAFALDYRPGPLSLSAGAGGLLGYTFTRYSLTAGTSGGGDIQSLQNMDRFDYGGFLFFDATYAELSVLFQGGMNSYRETMELTPHGRPATLVADNTGTGTELSLGFSLLGKYPFRVDDRFSFFPLLGIEYQIALLEWRKPSNSSIVYDRTSGKLSEDRDKDNNSYPLSAWNSLWIDLGAGADYGFYGPWYLRGELLFGFRLPTPYEDGATEMTKHQFNAPDPKLAGLTGSPTFKIAVGYKFQ